MIQFAGEGSKDAGKGRESTSPPSAKGSGGGPIEFPGKGNMDTSKMIDTNNPSGSVPGNDTINFAGQGKKDA